VLLASAALLIAVGSAMLLAISFKGNVKLAAVLPVIALAWFNRALRGYVQHVA